jgi:hypothetical protein
VSKTLLFFVSFEIRNVMLRFIFLLILSFALSLPVIGQLRVGKLIIRSHESFDLGQSDILVADTLIMMDSSSLILNKLKKDNFIRAQVIILGNHCVIDGSGMTGSAGRQGKNGITPIGPCRDGTPGRDGTRGLDGTPGVNLYLYVEKIIMKGKAVIDLSGGNGGTGGTGGAGGSGSPGTLHCNGGNGASGGNGGAGGNGASGGNLVLNSPINLQIQELIGKDILVRNQGGYYGAAGRAGYYGSAGLGPGNRNGRDGKPGNEGTIGLSGTRGTITYESN